jgi:hypothetical protein
MDPSDEKRSATDTATNDMHEMQSVTPDAGTEVEHLPDPRRKLNPGGKWKQAEVHDIPKNNLKVVFPA